ncbi:MULTISPECIES: VIT1/CCC1 family protein [Isoptericola]|uniref:Rubrerythrin family protein n=1 Tax=Isoptericola sediminis TaxID=2733572 RepID=A0A849K336_9MICO|nr:MULTISPECIES: VIT1/CCC1 family protein [Isoptericola]MDO8143546.1 VIT1/CCC1 family protein [Isoptericola sp. 178]MDO8147411.1 VIT1/CCC1 family protein [Isoptericola sp. b515]MDO8150279.1 VIT1/CCC1 family protein [Isoptericola sp. b408]NNU27668.1 rubrerythrin family protein [Isoptericola sediminis]
MDAPTPTPTRTPAEIRRWRRYLAAERCEAAVYRDLAATRTGEEREILLALAAAEKRHEQHWLDLLGDDVGMPRRGDPRTRMLAFLARRLGGVFVLALVQRAESRSSYADDGHATAQMAADEQIHEEVVRSLATRGRNRLSGSFRAAVFGANDGLVSNLALVLGIGASGVTTGTVLLTGLAGLLAGALSMGAGEYVSVRSQRELLEASTPAPSATDALPDLDVDANELALVYRARGMDADEAEAKADGVLHRLQATGVPEGIAEDEEQTNHETHGTAWGAAVASFFLFSSGAIVPVLPYLFGLEGTTAVVVASALVGLCLLVTGAVTGLLSGTSPFTRAGRQLLIGFGAAGATYLLGLAFGTTVA